VGISVRLVTRDFLPKVHAFLRATNNGKEADIADANLAVAAADIPRKPRFVMATTPNDEIVGAMCFNEEFFSIDTWGISWLNVHENYRLQGIASQMIKLAVSEIQKCLNGKKGTLILVTYPQNTKLYEKFGFEVIGQDHENDSIMTKVLEPLS